MISKHKTIITLCLTAIIFTSLGLVRINLQEITPDDFWHNKYHTTGEYDLVFAGSSRVVQGISPKAMKPILPQYRIFNYGFSGSVLTDSYLKAIEEVLDSESATKTIVLDLPPLASGLQRKENGRFGQVLKQLETHRFANTIFSDFLKMLSPFDFDRLPGNNIPDKWGIIKIFHEDGFIFTRVDDLGNRTNRRIYGIRQKVKNSKVESIRIDILLSYVRRWSKQGIRVIGIRIPTIEAITNLEDKLEGYDHSAFTYSFKKAGGIWVDTAEKEYNYYDGSHLTGEGAMIYSKDLAMELSNLLLK